tara:strand:- start:6 stop:767 length:762 start_codon:yes stop_codon:yes gene_type:complete
MYKIFIILFLYLILYLLIKKITQEDFKEQTKIMIILPIRNRDTYLDNYLKNVLPILKKQNIDYKIIIVEQSPDKLFNKGKINNIGFKEGTRMFNSINNIYFNDIDNFPLNSNVINFNEPIKNVKHFFGYKHCLGGIFSVNKNIFNKINGFSNNFYGWGYEDVDIQNRFVINKINISRSNFLERKNNKNIFFDEITKKKNKKTTNLNITKSNNYFKLYNNNKKNIFKDGLNTCNYKIKKKNEIYKNVFRIKVDL